MNPFAFVGLGIDLLGMILIVAGVLVPGEARWPLIVTGGVLSFVGVVMFVVGRQAGRFYGLSPRLVEKGIPATAVVEQMRDTRIVFRNSPVVAFRLKVTHEARDYLAQVQQAVPRRLAEAVRPGSRLAVKVDPDDPGVVAIDWSQAPTPPPAAPAAVAQPAGSGPAGTIPPEERPSTADLLSRGRRGTARIVAAQEMSDTVRPGAISPAEEQAGAMPMLFDLEVKLPGRPPYPVRVVDWVPASLAGRVGPGREVVVAVDRDDPERWVAIDWQAATG